MTPPHLGHLEKEFSSLQTIIVVHGTFAAGETWWRPGGDFCRQLDAALAARGTATKCWRDAATRRYFSWSGDNSETARRIAGRHFAHYLREVAVDPAISQIHIVAHSHGGNVVYRALYELQSFGDTHTSRRIGEIVFLGVPWLQFDEYKFAKGLYGLLSDDLTPAPENKQGLFAGLSSFLRKKSVGVSILVVLCLALGIAQILLGRWLIDHDIIPDAFWSFLLTT